jgi:hypothetical protein
MQEVFMDYCRASLTKVMAIPRLEAASVVARDRRGLVEGHTDPLLVAPNDVTRNVVSRAVR